VATLVDPNELQTCSALFIRHSAHSDGRKLKAALRDPVFIYSTLGKWICGSLPTGAALGKTLLTASRWPLTAVWKKQW